jgi:dynein heavy chain
VLTGDTLLNMGQVIKEVYLPLLDFELTDGDGDGQVDVAAIAAGGDGTSDGVHEGAVTIGSTSNIAVEFKSNMQRFAGHIAHAIRQVRGDVQLQVPNIHIDDPDAVTEYYEVVAQLESAMEDWSKLVATVVEQENAKRPKGKGPLAEIEFWAAQRRAERAVRADQHAKRAGDAQGAAAR